MKNEKMKKNFLTSVAFALALGLVACDDSTSANGSSGDENPAEVSSSSVIPSEAKQSSSSVVSSSSVTSSSSAKSSSSSVVSSSSSSSAPTEDPSDSKLAWQYLNPNIDYGEFTDARDGQVYKTVTIGTQTWMAENLNYAYTGVKFNNSRYTSDSTSWCYDNKASNCEKYGRLYTWSAVMDSAAQFSVNAGTECGYGKTCTPNSPHRGICPEGWHVPTNEEYSTLYTYIGGSSTAGKMLKSTSGWNNGYNGKSGNGTDKYGFSVLPAGCRDDNGNFSYEGRDACLWSASEYNSGYAWYQVFYYEDADAAQNGYYKYYGQSLRCLKD
ncbi:MAG: fibrobacter succinogenes major paralogous domain-containing protein [Fibrobacter sp.]|nr:fibrobacter succinogenes major paralogous domain-containing protein [Fibrobacter sp.]